MHPLLYCLIGCIYYLWCKMEIRTIEALVRAYLSLEQAAITLYEEFELAVQTGNYNDASLLESQADKVYELAENLEIIIREQGG
jgi:hypothetical protein